MALFEFATAGKILFGGGHVNTAGELTATLGTQALLVCGSSSERSNILQEKLTSAGIGYVIFQVCGEPTIQVVADGVALGLENDCDVVAAFGGGSVIDAGKAIAALLTNGGTPLDYLEVIGKGLALTKPSAPLIAIPTTAGTGAEVTRNAVLHSPEHEVKVSLRSPYMLPDVALIDPELTYSLPPEVTAATGLDALTQCLEPYVSHLANPLTDAIASDGLRRAARSVQRAYENGDDQDAREDMALASLFGGLALANAKLGAVHGFAGVLGGMYGAPHGIVCAALLPAVMEVNLRSLQRGPLIPDGERTMAKYGEVARILTGDARAYAHDGVTWLQELCQRLNVPQLGKVGLRRDDFDGIVEKASVSSSMKGNPVTLTTSELREILGRVI